MEDWNKIKAEYITTDTSYRKLAEKYGVTCQRIYHRSRQEGWIEARQQHKDKTITKTLEKISENQSERSAKINTLADKLIDKLEKAISEVDMSVVVKKEKITKGNKETTTEYREAKKGGTVDRNGLRQLAAVLKDLKEVQDIHSVLDTKEQEARIKSMEERIKTPGDGTDGQSYGVIMLPDIQTLTPPEDDANG